MWRMIRRRLLVLPILLIGVAFVVFLALYLVPGDPAEVIGDWLRLAGDGAVEPLALGLMARHYDPRYEKHRARSGGAQDRTVTTESLAPEALGPLADRLAGTLRDIFG